MLCTKDKLLLTSHRTLRSSWPQDLKGQWPPPAGVSQQTLHWHQPDPTLPSTPAQRHGFLCERLHTTALGTRIIFTNHVKSTSLHYEDPFHIDTVKPQEPGSSTAFTEGEPKAALKCKDKLSRFCCLVCHVREHRPVPTMSAAGTCSC